MRVIILLLVCSGVFGQKIINDTNVALYHLPLNSYKQASALYLFDTTSLILYADPIPSVKVVNNIATLSFTGTNIGSFQWLVQPGNQYYFGGSDMSTRTVTLQPGIKYTFTLTTWDKAGNKPVSVVTNYDPVVVVPKKDTCAKFLFIMFTDGTTTTIKQ